MKPSYWLIVILLVAVGVQQVMLKDKRADIKALQAQVKPLQDGLADANRISEGHRTALNACEAEKVRMATANAQAAQRAADNAAKSAQQAEAFLTLLANPPAGQDCETFLRARICPALLDY